MNSAVDNIHGSRKGGTESGTRYLKEAAVKGRLRVSFVGAEALGPQPTDDLDQQLHQADGHRRQTVASYQKPE